MDYHNMMLNNYEREQEELAMIERRNEEYAHGVDMNSINMI
jgi:hypothetical protein